MRTALLLIVVAALAACSAQATPTVSSGRTSATAARGLPQQLVPADFGTPQYQPPRNACPPRLRDQARPEVQLTLEQSRIRIDWERATEGTSTTTTTSRVPEGEYRVSPDTTYGLQPRQLLRVDCDSQSAVTVVEPAA